MGWKQSLSLSFSCGFTLLSGSKRFGSHAKLARHLTALLCSPSLPHPSVGLLVLMRKRVSRKVEEEEEEGEKHGLCMKGVDSGDFIIK